MSTDEKLFWVLIYVPAVLVHSIFCFLQGIVAISQKDENIEMGFFPVSTSFQSVAGIVYSGAAILPS